MSSKTIFATVLISVFATTSIGVFLIPITTPIISDVFPGLIPSSGENTTTIIQNNTTVNILNDTNLILQSLYLETSSKAQIFDENTTYQPIPNTSLSITIQDNSKISVEFSSIVILGRGPGQVGFMAMYIQIRVGSFSNRTLQPGYFFATAAASSESYFNYVHVYFETPPLSAGTYDITTHYKTGSPVAGSNIYELSEGSGSLTFPRTLLVQEMKTT
ncbi:MAG: hypothetical protein ACFFE8_16990 [Candidatus Heimdallarchaeota archaeon]